MSRRPGRVWHRDGVSVDLGPLRAADPDELGRFFGEVEPESLVAAVRATSDDELLDLLGSEQARTVALRGLLARLNEYAVESQLARVRGDVRIELVRRGLLLQAETIRIGDGTVTLLQDPPDPPGVVLRTSLLRFVRIVSGERNAGLEFLRGALDIEGDAGLALAVGGIFRVPGSDGVAVDPRDLDPVEVATALGEVRADHLKKVMRSGFRGVVLGEIFRRLPDFVDPDKAVGADLTIGFRLTGNPDGDVERYVVTIRDGTATVTPGDRGGERHATVTCEGHDFLRLATGHLNPVLGVLRGQLKVKGDPGKALALSGVIDIPRGR